MSKSPSEWRQRRLLQAAMKHGSRRNLLKQRSIFPFYRRLGPPTVMLALSLLIAAPAFAQNKGFNASTFLNTQYSDNLFLLPGGLQPPDNGPRSDLSTLFGVNLGLRLPFGRQALDVGAEILHERYNHYGQLDYTGGAAHVNLDFGFGSAWTGKTGYSYARRAVSFAYNTTDQRNLYRMGSLVADAYFRRGKPGLQSQFGFSRRTLSYTLPIYDSAKVITYAYNGGIGWLTLTGLRFGLQDTYTRGDYPNRTLGSGFLDTAYTNNDLRVMLQRQTRAGTKWEASIGYSQQKYPHFGGNNFSALVGNIRYYIGRNQRLGGEIYLSRSIYPVQTQASNFVVADSVGISPSYALTAKIDLVFNLGYTRLNYQGRGSQRQDRLAQIGVTLQWQVAKNWRVNTGYNRQRRSSNLARFNYHDNLFSAGINYLF